jgi:hypothetical protein
MAWALWLSAPVLVTGLAAVLTWLRGRSPRPPRTSDTIALHRAYLDALAPTPSALAPAELEPPDQAGSDIPDGADVQPR